MPISIKSKDIPPDSYLCAKEQEPLYTDAFEFIGAKSQSIQAVYVGIFGVLPKWIVALMQLRNAMVKPFGFPVEQQIQMAPSLEAFDVGAKAGFLTIEHIDSSEVVAAAYDKHMDLWISVMEISKQVYRVSTLVNLKTRRAKIYMGLIKPLHKLVAKQSIISAAKHKRI